MREEIVSMANSIDHTFSHLVVFEIRHTHIIRFNSIISEETNTIDLRSLRNQQIEVVVHRGERMLEIETISERTNIAARLGQMDVNERLDIVVMGL
jgi:hypothetical protein